VEALLLAPPVPLVTTVLMLPSLQLRVHQASTVQLAFSNLQCAQLAHLELNRYFMLLLNVLLAHPVTIVRKRELNSQLDFVMLATTVLQDKHRPNQ